MEEVLLALEKYVNKKQRDFSPKFFKAEKGEYAEGDKFLGITVPNSRIVAKKYADIPLSDVEQILLSPWHEMRLVALLILVSKFEKGNEKEREEIYNFYLGHSNFINNWDLVDLSAYKIVGEYIQDKPHKILYKFAQSKNIWEKRIAMVSTYSFIKRGELEEPYKIAEILLHDSHDLIQKAVGWMLREAGKKDEAKLKKFLEKNATSMPRTMLRYAIEKFPENERKEYLRK